jgi:hypothetical protein
VLILRDSGLCWVGRIMKIELIGMAAIFALATGTSVDAKPPVEAPPPAAAKLITALKTMAATATNPPGQSKRPSDPDQGDDHASMVAIEKVCTKNTPAAKRSAICNPSSSPN